MKKIIKKFNSIKENQKGVSLLELIVSISIFTLLIVMTTMIFKMVMDGQQNAITSQNTQESMRFAYEIMAKEIRTAIGDDDGSHCAETVGLNQGYYKVFNTEEGDGTPEVGNRLYFQNKNGRCVLYEVVNNAIWITRQDVDGNNSVSLEITPDEIEITNLVFFVKDDRKSEFHSLQPRVTMQMDVQPKTNKDKFRTTYSIQTTISSRDYR